MFVCWTVKMTQPSKDVARSSVTHCHGSFYIVLWDLTVSPHRSGVPRTQGTDPLPSLKKKKPSHGTQSINHLQQTSYLLYEKFNRMCVMFPKTNIWFQTSVLLNHVCISRSGVCLLFFPAVLHQMRHPGSFTNLIRCKDVGLLNGTPRFFFTW